MRVRRLVVSPGTLGGPGRLELGVEPARHLEVLRLRPGARLELTDGAGHVAAGVLVSLSRRSAAVELERVEAAEAEPGPRIVLLQGVGKGDKLDAVVRQTAELGASRLVPVLSGRAVARREGKQDRLRAIAEDALRISGRARRMQVDPPTPLASALTVAAELRIVLALDGARPLSEVLQSPEPPSEIALLVGPEGGFSPDELEAAVDAGFVAAHLGPHTLRTETAGPAVVAMARYHFLGC